MGYVGQKAACLALLALYLPENGEGDGNGRQRIGGTDRASQESDSFVIESCTVGERFRFSIGTCELRATHLGSKDY